MNNTKGLSQILYLVIAASVLMIAALTMVFMLDEGLSGVIEFGGEASATACDNRVEATCRGSNAVRDAPTSCFEETAEGVETVPGLDPNIDGALDAGDETVDCSDLDV